MIFNDLRDHCKSLPPSSFHRSVCQAFFSGLVTGCSARPNGKDDLMFFRLNQYSEPAVRICELNGIVQYPVEHEGYLWNIDLNQRYISVDNQSQFQPLTLHQRDS